MTGTYLLKRVAASLFLLCLLLVLVFFVGHVIGDPVTTMLPADASPERVASMRERFGLNDPLTTQFATFVHDAVFEGFGESLWQRKPALPLVLDRVPATLYLAAAALAIVIPVGVGLGLLAARNPGSRADRAVTVLAFGSASIVDFWLGLTLILVVSVQLGLVPTSGFGGPSYVLLPALTLAAEPIGRLAQLTRAMVIEKMSEPFIAAARARGISETRVLFRHGFRNALVPLVTVIGGILVSLAGGAIIAEVVFAWPGVGLLLVEAIERRDLPLIEAAVFFAAVLVTLVNLAVDLLYHHLDPRLEIT